MRQDRSVTGAEFVRGEICCWGLRAPGQTVHACADAVLTRPLSNVAAHRLAALPPSLPGPLSFNGERRHLFFLATFLIFRD